MSADHPITRDEAVALAASVLALVWATSPERPVEGAPNLAAWMFSGMARVADMIERERSSAGARPDPVPASPAHPACDASPACPPPSAEAEPAFPVPVPSRSSVEGLPIHADMVALFDLLVELKRIRALLEQMTASGVPARGSNDT